MKRKTITAVSKHNNCSHKFHCYLGGQHRLATSFLLLRFHHWNPPRVCIVQSKFQANRLRRLPAAPLNPLTGFNFCMHLPCICTDGTAAYTLALTPNPAPFCPLILHLMIYCWTSRSYKTRRCNNTARGGMQAVPLFCKISVSHLDTAARLDTSLSCVPNTF